MHDKSVIRKIVEKVPNHVKGRFCEHIARVYFQIKGFKIVKCNEQRGFAQIDLIVTKAGTLHVIEVKFRVEAADAALAIHPHQLARLQAQAALYQRRYTSYNIQIDGFFVFLNYPFIKHVENIG